MNANQLVKSATVKTAWNLSPNVQMVMKTLLHLCGFQHFKKYIISLIYCIDTLQILTDFFYFNYTAEGQCKRYNILLQMLEKKKI